MHCCRGLDCWDWSTPSPLSLSISAYTYMHIQDFAFTLCFWRNCHDPMAWSNWFDFHSLWSSPYWLSCRRLHLGKRLQIFEVRKGWGESGGHYMMMARFLLLATDVESSILISFSIYTYRHWSNVGILVGFILATIFCLWAALRFGKLQSR